MRLCWCTITTDKLEDSIHFYSEIVGLTVASRFSPYPNAEIVFLKDEAGTEIELMNLGKPTGDLKKEGISVGFTVDSLEDKLAFVKSKGIEVNEPVSTPTVKFFFVKDPNGVTVQFVETIKK